MKKILMLILVVFSLCLFCGCPDYSHLRPTPDYKNMSDAAPEGEIGADAEESQ